MMTENWYALWVKSRHEFVTAEELSRKSIVNFVPSVARTRQWKDRKKVVNFPLFPGYLFVHIAPEPALFLDVVKTRGSVGFVSLEPGHPSSIAPEDIVSLKIMLACGEPIDVFPAFREGMIVRVKRGPLCSAVGILIKKEGCHIFLVNFDILGRSVGLKICADDVELA
jgi:transcription termination/antitermination protein NusG